MPIGLDDLFTSANQSAGEPSVAGASEGGLFSYASDLTNLISRGADVYTNLKEAKSLTDQRKVATKAAATVSTNESGNRLVLYLVFGAVVILVLFLYLRR